VTRREEERRLFRERTSRGRVPAGRVGFRIATPQAAEQAGAARERAVKKLAVARPRVPQKAEVASAVLRNEGGYLKALRRADLAPEVLEQILGDRGARRYHAVRLALAGHPRTPRREALTLVLTLFWRDLARLSADARVHPEVRRAADRELLRRLPEMALAERADLGRSVGRGTLLALRFDSDPRVVAAVLDNRFLTEPDVVQAAARREAGVSALEVIAAHPRWSLRQAVRSALLRNPRLPVPAALTLLPRASARDLAGLRDSQGVSRLVKACAERVLAERASRV